MKKRLIAGTINVYEPEEGWKNYHLDVTSRGVWDRDLSMAVAPEFIGDIRNLVDFRDEMFDAIQLWHVLEHLDMVGGHAALAELHRVLVPGGILDIEVPDMDRIAGAWVDGSQDRAGLQQWIYGEDIGDAADYHRYGWTGQSLADALRATDFEIVDSPDTGLAVRYICAKPVPEEK